MGDDLLAATHGRGVYRATLSGLALEAGTVSWNDSGGNNNGIVEPGEAISLNIQLTNPGSVGATNVSGTLAAPPGAVTFQNAVSPYPDLPAGSTALNSTLFTFSVSGIQPCGTLTLELAITSNQGDGLIPDLEIPVCRQSILLVDDDADSPDVRPTYTAALEALGLSYAVWDVAATGAEPDGAALSAYEKVIWFSGDQSATAGPGLTAENTLGAWLEGGQCLFLSSQEYYYPRGSTVTHFMETYLGVQSVTDDGANFTSVTGQNSVFSGFGPYSLVYPGLDLADALTPAAGAEAAFLGENGLTGAIQKSTDYLTTYWAFPWEAISDLNARTDTLLAFLNRCRPAPDVHVLLVDDDDNNPDVRPYYTVALNFMNQPYAIWETRDGLREPGSDSLAYYDQVIWFSGNRFGEAGPGAATESALGDWLDTGNCLLLSSQEYFYDRGQVISPFMSTYLGLQNAVDDGGTYTSLSGQGAIFSGLGPFILSFPDPMTDHTDALTPSSGAETAFLGNDGIIGAITKTGTFLSSYWAFPLETLPDRAARTAALNAFQAGCVASNPLPTATATHTATPTPITEPTFTPTPTASPIGVSTATATVTPTAVPAETFTPTPTGTALPAQTGTPTPTPTVTATPTVGTNTPTNTPTHTATLPVAPDQTATPTLTATKETSIVWRIYLPTLERISP